MTQEAVTPHRKLAAIMFTDIVGYTPMMTENEAKALQILTRQREILRPIIESFNGEWLKEIGDGSLSSFPSAVDALRCAIKIQNRLKEETDISLRIGVHIGDVVVEGHDVLGDGVNIASRIEALAEPGGVYFSERVYEDIRNKPDIPINEVGIRNLKGVDRPIKVYRVGQDHNSLRARTRAPRSKKWIISPVMAGVFAVVLIICFILWSQFYGPGKNNMDGTINSLAVLPLDNLMNDAGEDYFVDGMHDALLTELSRIQAVRVISRTSVLGYRDNPKSIQEIARELGVDAIIEGSVLKADQQVRINLQLIQAEPEKHIWAEAFDRDLKDILNLHKEVAQEVAEQVKVTLNPQEKLHFSTPVQVDPNTQLLYLKGLKLFEQGKASEAEIQFIEIIRLAPDFAPAYSRLASSYYHNKYFGSPAVRVPKSEEMANQALKLEPDNVEALQILALIAMSQYWNWDQAKIQIDEALRVNPGNHKSHEIYSQYLAAIGNTEEAVREAELAAMINPLDRWTVQNLGQAYYRNGQNKQALEQYRILHVLAPEKRITHLFEGLAYAEEHEFQRAIDSFVEYAGDDTVFAKQLVQTFEEQGYNGALKMWAEYWAPASDTPRIRAISVALIYAKAGIVDKAIEYLEKSYDLRETPLINIKSEPQFAPIRHDPRYLDIVARMGLN